MSCTDQTTNLSSLFVLIISAGVGLKHGRREQYLRPQLISAITTGYLWFFLHIGNHDGYGCLADII